MIFNVIEVICILMAAFAVLTLFQSKIKWLGKILGSIVAVLIALASNDANLVTEGLYLLVNIMVLLTTIYFRIRMKKEHRWHQL